MKILFFLISICCKKLLRCSSYEDLSVNAETVNEHDIPPRIRKSISVLPTWLQEYIEWHQETRETKLNDPQTKFLTLGCHRDYACGGLSDRLRTVPYFLLAAYKTNRLFFIKWQKFDLEDFMIPPEGGIDWRLPEHVDFIERPWNQRSCAEESGRICQFWEHTEDKYTKEKNIFINSRNDLYAELREEYFASDKRPLGTFSDIMSILFKPTKGLRREIFTTMKSLGLRPRNYLAAHFRARYPYLLDRKARMSPEHKQNILHNSIDCVVHKHGSKDKPIYFTSDGSAYVKYLTHDSPFAMKNSTVQVVGIDETMRENIDEGVDYESRDAEEFYPVFVDMFLLANSACVSYGQGGYGLFGARFAGERCMIQHQVLWNMTYCPSALSTEDVESTNEKSNWLH